MRATLSCAAIMTALGARSLFLFAAVAHIALVMFNTSRRRHELAQTKTVTSNWWIKMGPPTQLMNEKPPVALLKYVEVWLRRPTAA